MASSKEKELSFFWLVLTRKETEMGRKKDHWWPKKLRLIKLESLQRY